MIIKRQTRPLPGTRLAKARARKDAAKFFETVYTEQIRSVFRSESGAAVKNRIAATLKKIGYPGCIPPRTA